MTRTEKYMARVLSHLPKLADEAARRAFLIAEQEKWEERYQQFMRTVDSGGDPGDVTAFEYSETIGALSIALAPFERRAA